MIQISEKLADLLKSASSVIALTGAGISAESGVPTFRGSKGLWRRYKPEQLATPEAFQKDPKLIWEWYDWRRSLIYNIKPNRAHKALVEFEEYFPEFALITQNIDGLHYRAGSSKILELHGNIWRMRNVKTNETRINFCEHLDSLPPTAEDGTLLRPDVVWFGESLDPEILEQAVESSRNADLFFVVGTSGVVHPAASLPMIARDSGAYLVEANPQETPLTAVVDESLRGTATEIMDLLAEEILGA